MVSLRSKPGAAGICEIPISYFHILHNTEFLYTEHAIFSFSDTKPLFWSFSKWQQI